MIKEGDNSGDDLIDQILGELRKKDHEQLTIWRDKIVNKPRIDIVERYLSSRYKIRLNTISNTCECSRLDSKEFEEVNENELYRELQKKKISCSLSNLKSLMRSKYVNEHNPFEAYFSELPQWKKGIRITYPNLADM